ncbi:putative damage-inducible protein DinB [Oxalobacteraceae bacterium GrIS 1.11]
MSRTQHVCLMAQYNRWMNAKLYRAAATLPAAELGADRKAFFGSILGTLNHLVAGDTLWLKRFALHPAHYAALAPLQDWPTPSSLDQMLFTTLEPLARHRHWLDDMIVAWAETVTQADLDHTLAYTNKKGIASERNYFSLLMHFFNHQTHHRGQVTTLLSQAGVDVGETDLLALIPAQSPPR